MGCGFAFSLCARNATLLSCTGSSWRFAMVVFTSDALAMMMSESEKLARAGVKYCDSVGAARVNGLATRARASAIVPATAFEPECDVKKRMSSSGKSNVWIQD